jgi:2-C-methyl-D-erythritol 4-phosphate cytidylyltransferase
VLLERLTGDSRAGGFSGLRAEVFLIVKKKFFCGDGCMSQKKISAVVVAAGSSRRMGVDKLFVDLRGHPVLWHSVRVMAAVPGCREIVVVTREENFQRVQNVLDDVKFGGICHMVPGGAERQDSVRAGLRAVSSEAEYVMIHDAARPFTRRETAEATLEAAFRHGAAVCGCEVADTIKRVAPDGRVVETPPRGELRAVQTPQIFERKLIFEAYEKLAGSGLMMTDDTAVAAWAGYPVYVVTSPYPNPKITYPGDVELYQHLLG